MYFDVPLHVTEAGEFNLDQCNSSQMSYSFSSDDNGYSPKSPKAGANSKVKQQYNTVG